VLDILDGRVVRGVAGRRHEYAPVQSALTSSCEPLAVARALRDRFGLCELYVADLDAILHGTVNASALRALTAEGFSVLVDAGIRQASDASPILEAGVSQIVAGLETLASPGELARLCREHGSNRIIFSLDLRDGVPLGNRDHWLGEQSLDVARLAVEAGATQMIVLDIARVGVAKGVATLPLCAAIKSAFPQATLITGGGVRDGDDLRRLAQAEIDGVLIASALHDGSISRDELGLYC
jgi:phosphoribosylformimino-5-aminoimidazole carboxamide ribotide isomerase